MARRLIGIGNPDRGDDAAGWEVAGAVSTWMVNRFTAGSVDIIDLWGHEDDVVIVDAMRSGLPPGAVRRFDASTEPLPVGAFKSTHAFGPAAAIELARTLGRMPKSVAVYGIEIGHTDHGRPMSPAVAASVSSVAKELEHA